VHGSAIRPLEPGSKLAPGFVLAPVEAISERDLLVVVSGQESDLVSRNVGCEIKPGLCSDAFGTGPGVGTLTLWSSPAKARAV